MNIDNILPGQPVYKLMDFSRKQLFVACQQSLKGFGNLW